MCIRDSSLAEDSFTELYAHKDNSLFIPCRITEDDRYIFFTVAINYSRTQVFCLDTVTQNVEDISGEPAGLNFYIGNIGGRHYLQSDREYKNGAIYSFELTDGKVRQRKLIITAVSYTHLEGYDHGIGPVGADEFHHRIYVGRAQYGGDLVAVSYTHLDVYKRQGGGESPAAARRRGRRLTSGPALPTGCPDSRLYR